MALNALSSFNDGKIPHAPPSGQGGSQLAGVYQLQRNGGALAFMKFENVDLRRPTNSVDVSNPDGSPLGGFDVAKHDNGTATIQIPNVAGPFPLRGDYFTEDLTPDGVIGVQTYRLTEVGSPYPMEDYWKVNVTFKRVYNSANFTSSSQ